MINEISRRNFLRHGCSGAGALLLSSHLSAIVSAAAHARSSMQPGTAAKLEFFTPAEAAEIDALTARIIPTDDMPGAREAGVVYFIDRALTTFSVDDQKTYRDGLLDLQEHVHAALPAVAKFSAATPEQQDEILRTLDNKQSSGGRAFRPRAAAKNFFETLRVHTILGFVIDPDSSEFGNRDGAGWKVIGREREHMFQPPFGYYDKDYAGWRPDPDTGESNKA